MMTEEAISCEQRQPRPPGWLETHFEALLFGSRWIAAPIYLGLVFGLVMLLVIFFRDLWESVMHLPELTRDVVISRILDSIDIALLANLLLIVVLAGYEHFVSKIDTAADEDRPGWMGTVDFSGIKLKLFASIIGLTGIEILKTFMKARPGLDAPVPLDRERIAWMLIIHVTFLFTALLSALADWLTSKTEAETSVADRLKAEACMAAERARGDAAAVSATKAG